MKLDFVSLFPEWIQNALSVSIPHRAQQKGAVSIRSANPRDFALDERKTVDDKPFGGGPGMLMLAQTTEDALLSLQPEPGCAIVMPDPTGHTFTQAIAQELAQKSHVVIVCGHYEGIDERFAEKWVTHRISIGDYVLSGGETAGLVIADAIIRLLPGVLGDADSLAIDSHSDGLLSAPQFTRPEIWDGREVPAVLRSGDHGAIAKWKRKQALRLTRELRPDLFALAPLEKGDLDMLES